MNTKIHKIRIECGDLINRTVTSMSMRNKFFDDIISSDLFVLFTRMQLDFTGVFIGSENRLTLKYEREKTPSYSNSRTS